MNKSSIIAGILLLALSFGAYVFFVKPKDITAPVTSETVSASLTEGYEILALLNDLNAINLKGDVFQSVGWKNLVDQTIPLPQEPSRRKNPFAPIGVDASSSVIPPQSSSFVPVGTPPPAL